MHPRPSLFLISILNVLLTQQRAGTLCPVSGLLLALLFWRTSIIFYKVQNVIFCICQLNQTFWFYICFISQQNFSLFCTLFKVPFSRAFFRYYRRNDVGLAMAGLFLTIESHCQHLGSFPCPRTAPSRGVNVTFANCLQTFHAPCLRPPTPFIYQLMSLQNVTKSFQ